METSRVQAPRFGPARTRALKAAAASAIGLGLVASSLAASLPAQATGATSPASSSPAVVHKTAAKAATKTLPFRWENGTQVKATVVTAAQATVLKGSSIQGYATGAVQWENGPAQALPDGRVVGILNGKVMVQDRTGKLRNYYSGSFKAGVEYLFVQGTTVLGMSQGRTGVYVYVFKGTGSKPSTHTYLPTPHLWASPVLAGGKIFYSRLTYKQNSITGSQVLSVPLGKGTATVVAKNARDPQLLNGKVVFSTIKPVKDHYYGGELTGLKRLSDSKILLKYTKSLWPWSSWADDALAGLNASPNAAVVTGDNVAGDGQLIMDLMNRKAWIVQPPKGTVATSAVASGTRATWTWTKPFDWDNPGYKAVPVFDTASSKYTIYTTNNRALFASVNGTGFTYMTINNGARSSYGFGRLR